MCLVSKHPLVSCVTFMRNFQCYAVPGTRVVGVLWVRNWAGFSWVVLLLCVMSTDTQLVDGLLWSPRGSAHMAGILAGGWKADSAGAVNSRWPPEGQAECCISSGLPKWVSRESIAAGMLLGSSFGLPSMSFCHIPLANHVSRAGLHHRLPFCGRRSKDCFHL